MKTIIFFDIDNTIVDSNTGKVPTNTKKMLKELSKREDVLLGIATGRGPSRLDVIDDVVEYFDALVAANGAYVVLFDKLIYESYFSEEQISEVIRLGKKHDLLIGMSGVEEDVHIRKTPRAADHLNHETEFHLNYHLDNHIYQAWVATRYKEDLDAFARELTTLNYFYWSKDGLDIARFENSKANGIDKIKEILKPVKVVAIGDGHNDLEMIEKADIGIAMGNSRFDEVIKKADFIGPKVSEDKLPEFLKTHKII